MDSIYSLIDGNLRINLTRGKCIRRICSLVFGSSTDAVSADPMLISGTASF